MHTALTEIRFKEIDCFLKIRVVFDQLFIQGYVRDRGTASDPLRIEGRDGVRKGGEPVSILALALAYAEFQKIAVMPAVRCGPGLFTEPLVVFVVSEQIADEEMISEKLLITFAILLKLQLIMTI